MKLKLLILLLGFSLSAQPTVKILAKGTVLAWKIFEMDDNGTVQRCFSYKSNLTKIPIEIGITTIDDLKQLILKLKEYARATKIISECSDTFLIEFDGKNVLLSDFRKGYVTLTKSKAVSLASELENNAEYLK